jgi:dTMP kinase
MIGKLIVLEGVDGAGTTTQAARLGETLVTGGRAAIVTREPSTGPIGTLIRQFLVNGVQTVDQRAMALLFASDRLDHLRREIVPALEAGTHVICDRYVLSSLVYQSRFVEAEFVCRINEHARPADLTLCLDVDAEVAQSRRKARGSKREMYERLELQRKFVAHYRSGIPEAWRAREHFVTVDGARTPDEVFEEVHAHVESCLAGASESSSTR